jgi:hypothetical protein
MFFNQVKEGIIEYAQTEIINKAEGPMKFVLYTGVALLTPKLDEMYAQYKQHPVIKALGVIKENDEIDVPILYNAMKDAIKKLERFELMGVIFNEQDVDILYRNIMRHQGGGESNETQTN